MWSSGCQGNDINAADVCRELGLCINGDDDGCVNVLTFPSIVKNAPKRIIAAHSSHVMNVKFFKRQDGYGAISLGGRDTTIAVWRVESASR